MPASYTPYRHGNRLTFKQGKAISNLGKSHNDNVIQWPAYVTQYFEIQPALLRHMHTVRNHCKSVFDNDLEYKKSIMCLALSTTAITDTLESLSTAGKFGRSVSTTLLNHQLPSITSPVTTSISQLVRQTACSDLWMCESADRGGLWWGKFCRAKCSVQTHAFAKCLCLGPENAIDLRLQWQPATWTETGQYNIQSSCERAGRPAVNELQNNRRSRI